MRCVNPPYRHPPPPTLQDNPIKLPELQKAAPSAPFDPRTVIIDRDEDAASLEAHVQRWRAERQHIRESAARARQPYERQLSDVIAACSGVQAQQAAQQQQFQLLQQQQQQLQQQLQ